MSLAIFDTGVLVNLAHANNIEALARVSRDRVVTDEVDAEITRGRSRHPTDVAQYDEAIAKGLLRVEEIVVGGAAYVEFLRLRVRRGNPMRNRGEDSCIALALTQPESVVYLDDHGATRRAQAELGDAARVLSSNDI